MQFNKIFIFSWSTTDYPYHFMRRTRSKLITWNESKAEKLKAMNELYMKYYNADNEYRFDRQLVLPHAQSLKFFTTSCTSFTFYLNELSVHWYSVFVYQCTEFYGTFENCINNSSWLDKRNIPWHRKLI